MFDQTGSCSPWRNSKNFTDVNEMFHQWCYIYISATVKKNIAQMLKPQDIENMNPNDTTIYTWIILDKYEICPDHVDDLDLDDFASSYIKMKL